LSASNFVTLVDGPTVPVAALQLLLALEARGCRLRAEGDALLVSPRDRLTDVDRDQIRRWKWHLMALATYEPRSIQ
jgi:hypothetical protein